MKKSMLALIFGSALVLAACGGGNKDESASTQSEGEKLVKTSCATCHGGNLQGVGNTPALDKIGAKYTEEQILNIILNGKGNMPPGMLKGEQAELAAAWLAEQK